MDYLVFFVATALIVAVFYVLSWFPKYTKEGVDLFWRERNLQDLKRIVVTTNFILILSTAFFLLCVLIIFGIWDALQRNMIQNISRYEFVAFVFLLFVFILKTYSIRRKALIAFHNLCENNIVEAMVESQKKGSWICKFTIYGEELWGYLDEKPSFDMVKAAVLKYDNRMKMYLLQEMH